MENEKSEFSVEDEASLKELLIQGADWVKYLLSKWKIIVLAGILGGAIGLAYAYSKKPIYTANLTFALEDGKSGGGLGGALGLASSFGFDMGGGGGGVFVGANLIELFKSRTMVEQTLLSPVDISGDTISLAEMFIQNNNWRERWKDNPKLAGIHFSPTNNRKTYSRTKDSILGVIYGDLSRNGLSVGQQDEKIAIINIAINSTNELFAKLFTETLVENVSDFYIATKSKKSRDNLAILEKQTDSIRDELNKAITGVALANDNTFNLNPALNVKRAPSARRQVDVQANTAILTELVKQTELAKIGVRKDSPLIQIIDQPILPLKKEQFGKLKGLVFGGFIFGFLACVFFITRKYFRDILAEE